MPDDSLGLPLPFRCSTCAPPPGATRLARLGADPDPEATGACSSSLSEMMISSSWSHITGRVRRLEALTSGAGAARCGGLGTSLRVDA